MVETDQIKKAQLTHVTLTDVIVDELRERAHKAEARVAALEAAIEWYEAECYGYAYCPDPRDAILQHAEQEMPMARYLLKVRSR